MTKTPPGTRPFPSKQEILTFIREQPGRVGKREIARAFGIRGAERQALKSILRDLEKDGEIDRHGRRVAPPGKLPEVTVIEVVGEDTDGEIVGRPAVWHADTPPPPIVVAPERGPRHALAAGDRVLARIRRREGGTYEAQVMRKVGARTSTVIGVFRETARGGRLEPTDRRYKSEYAVARTDRGEAADGDLVLAEVVAGRLLGLPQARVRERLGDIRTPKAFSLIAIHSHDIPFEFPEDALALAREARPVTPEGRTDLRDLPLVTIDGADARDFDDAVHAEPDRRAGKDGGWLITVAIADVAHYVRPGDALDRAARERGNSVYFPDRVVPMLPTELSNDLCSLRPDEDRACLAVRMHIAPDGRLTGHKFVRGIMRSAARLTYEQVQMARDGRPDPATAPLVDRVIAPLYGAYEALAAARRDRGTLEIDLPERKVVLDDDGTVKEIVAAPRFDSHRLIEAFMIAANVAAAETLERREQPCMYRVHDEPDPAKVEALREFLADLGLRLAKGQVIRPQAFNQVLRRAAGTPHAAIVSELVLRCQSQAVYSPENIGHFGLSLRRYAHFTSPIRRYADLLVHRALVRGLGFGKDGLPDGAEAEFERIGEHISTTERRAALAERDTKDRYAAAFLSRQVGETAEGRITGVTRFGLFVRLEPSGADGLVPIRTLGAERFHHDESQHALIGERSGQTFRLGDSVEVLIADADPVTGSAVFHLLAGPPSSPRRRGAAAARDKKRAKTRSGPSESRMPAGGKGKRRTPSPARRKQR